MHDRQSATSEKRAERAERQRDQAIEALRNLMDALSINDDGDLIGPLEQWAGAWVTAVETLATIEKDVQE